MAADEKDRFIQYLVDKVNTYELDKRARARKHDQQLKYAPNNKFGANARMPVRTRRRMTLPTVFHPTDDSKVLGRIMERKSVKVFSFKMCFVDVHYGSDEGVEMVVAYHRVISTVKFHGMSCWRYLGEFFKKIFNGCRDFFSLTPANIGMAYAKYRASEYKVKLACLYRVQPIFKC